jgi:gas vesicle protein
VDRLHSERQASLSPVRKGSPYRKKETTQQQPQPQLSTGLELQLDRAEDNGVNGENDKGELLDHLEEEEQVVEEEEEEEEEVPLVDNSVSKQELEHSMEKLEYVKALQEWKMCVFEFKLLKNAVEDGFERIKKYGKESNLVASNAKDGQVADLLKRIEDQLKNHTLENPQFFQPVDNELKKDIDSLKDLKQRVDAFLRESDSMPKTVQKPAQNVYGLITVLFVLFVIYRFLQTEGDEWKNYFQL